MGEEAARKRMFEAKGRLGLTDCTDYLVHSRQILVVARKEPRHVSGLEQAEPR
jgi:hypothetical protein